MLVKNSLLSRCEKGESYDGARIGPEPTTDSFNAVVYDEGANGKERRRKEGQIASKLGQTKDDDFMGLAKFGERFLNSFQVRAKRLGMRTVGGGRGRSCGSEMRALLVSLRSSRARVRAWQVHFTDNPDLRDTILIDTPGIMPGQVRASSDVWDEMTRCRLWE
jgi:hypothetical protein